MVEAYARPVVHVDVVHPAAISPNSAGMVGFEPGYDLGTLSLRRMEIDSPAGCVVAALARSGNTRARAVRRNNAHRTELRPDLIELGFQGARQTGRLSC